MEEHTFSSSNILQIISQQQNYNTITKSGYFAEFRKAVTKTNFVRVCRKILNEVDYMQVEEFHQVHFALIKAKQRVIAFVVISTSDLRLDSIYFRQKLILNQSKTSPALEKGEKEKEKWQKPRELMFLATETPNRLGALLQYYAIAWLKETDPTASLWMEITRGTLNIHGGYLYIEKLVNRYHGFPFQLVHKKTKETYLPAVESVLFQFGSWEEIKEEFQKFLSYYFVSVKPDPKENTDGGFWQNLATATSTQFVDKVYTARVIRRTIAPLYITPSHVAF